MTTAQFTLPSLAAMLIASEALFASPPANQFSGVWQFDNLMQAHKIVYRQLDCKSKEKLRTIKAIDDSKIEISNGEKVVRYSVVEKGKQMFLAQKNRRNEVTWEAPGATFLVHHGFQLHAYRRCAAL